MLCSAVNLVCQTGSWCVLSFIQVSGVGYDDDGEITTEEMYLNQGHLMEKDVVVDDMNHPGIRKIVEVITRFFLTSANMWIIP